MVISGELWDGTVGFAIDEGSSGGAAAATDDTSCATRKSDQSDILTESVSSLTVMKANSRWLKGWGSDRLLH